MRAIWILRHIAFSHIQMSHLLRYPADFTIYVRSGASFSTQIYQILKDIRSMSPLVPDHIWSGPSSCTQKSHPRSHNILPRIAQFSILCPVKVQARRFPRFIIFELISHPVRHQKERIETKRIIIKLYITMAIINMKNIAVNIIYNL